MCRYFPARPRHNFPQTLQKHGYGACQAYIRRMEIQSIPNSRSYLFICSSYIFFTPSMVFTASVLTSHAAFVSETNAARKSANLLYHIQTTISMNKLQTPSDSLCEKYYGYSLYGSQTAQTDFGQMIHFRSMHVHRIAFTG